MKYSPMTEKRLYEAKNNVYFDDMNALEYTESNSTILTE